MKKYIKISIIILLIIISIIVLDTVVARVLKRSPIISWRTNVSDSDSYVDKGILLDTYYCVKEKDIMNVSWHYKTSKFTCPIDNVNELDKIEDVSMVIKDGTLTRRGATIIITDTSGADYTYGEEYRIDKYKDGDWEELEVIVEGNYGWNSIGYMVDDNGILELEVKWEWLYGRLDDGYYRIVKSVNDKEFSVEFKID